MKEIITDLEKLSNACDLTVLQDEAKLNETIADIKDILFENKDLVALAAPQIGVNAQLFCIKFANNDIRTFINPMMKKQTGLHLSRESSPSIPNKEFIKTRFDEVEVAYQTPTGVIELNLFKGAVGEVFQQMYDLVFGITPDMFGLEVIDGWDDASEEERQEVIDYWLKSLEEETVKAKEAVDNDPKSKQISDAIDFMIGVDNGTIETQSQTIKLNHNQRRLLNKLARRKAKVVK